VILSHDGQKASVYVCFTNSFRHHRALAPLSRITA
jgi:hypothetical protein